MPKEDSVKKGALICCAAASIGFAGLPAMAKDGVAIALPDQRVAVLSEGDLEAASMGSYSVAVFKDALLLHFDAGAVFSRNGTIFRDDGKLRVKFADITGDGTQALVISKLTAGSGKYLEVDALRIDAGSVRLLTRVQTDTHHDEIAELKAACRRGACSPK
ncbi:PliI family lysozyme inhibitor of I-type lysozyme (plasmid) [Cupriavidus pinatubonensis]|nr:PliI family lysozyme inhibitor of I-type lysozyme [Cupriavidus pinatubonensis]